MKKLLSIVLSLAMVFSFSATTFATKSNHTENEKTVSANGYDFTITEKTSPDYSVSRTYTKGGTMAYSKQNDEETKAMLLALGMDEDEVNAIPTDTLQDFANGIEITVVIAYTKHNKTSETTTGIPESIALDEAATLNQQQENYIIQHQKEISTYDEKPNDSTTPGVFEDSYMRMSHSAIYQGNGYYKFTTSSRWLTMPFFRGYDSIGSCAMNGTVTPNTSSGKYWYTTKTYYMGNVSSIPSGNITITNRSNVADGNWYGSAGIFNLPNDPGGSSGANVMHTNLNAYYEYKGHVSQPTIESYFNTVGTYSHATIGISWSPSISINTSGTASASIGLSLIADRDVRNAEREIHFVP